MAEIAPSTVVLQVSDLAVEFPTRQRNRTVKAVNGVSFDVYAGETFGVIGESGSGKTTLGRALVSLIAPTRGRLLLGGVDPATLGKAALRKHRRDFQIMFQDPNAALNPRMRIIDSVMEPLEVAGHRDRAMNRTSALQAMARVGLPAEFAQRYPHQLSGGQRQRIVIARALAVKPSIIVADEPTSMLDVSIGIEIMNLMLELQKKEQLTYMYITHNLASARYMANRMIVMYAGNCVEQGDIDDIIERPLHPYTILLLSSTPEPFRKEKIEINASENLPDLTSVIQLCPFAERCPKATERCKKEKPGNYMVDGRTVKCFLYEGVKDGINNVNIDVSIYK